MRNTEWVLSTTSESINLRKMMCNVMERDLIHGWGKKVYFLTRGSPNIWTFNVFRVRGHTSPKWSWARESNPTEALCRSAASPVGLPRIGATRGIRTHTLQVLNLLPLPLGYSGEWLRGRELNPRRCGYEPHLNTNSPRNTNIRQARKEVKPSQLFSRTASWAVPLPACRLRKCEPNGHTTLPSWALLQHG